MSIGQTGWLGRDCVPDLDFFFSENPRRRTAASAHFNTAFVQHTASSWTTAHPPALQLARRAEPSRAMALPRPLAAVALILALLSLSIPAADAGTFCSRWVTRYCKSVRWSSGVWGRLIFIDADRNSNR